MSRLIDADKLKEVIEKEKDDNDYICGLCMESTKEIIEEQPTAFDVEKVIEKLQVLSDKAADDIAVCEADACQYYDGYGDGLDRAIEIVKRGGRND